MAVLFLDTSAAVKRYVAETGSAWVRQVTDASGGNRVYLSALAGPEMVATLVRGARSQPPLARQLTRLLAAFQTDWTNLFRTIEVDGRVIASAMRLAESHGLRGADAVHLATALELQRQRDASGRAAITFVSADRDQLAAAAQEGLQAEDPNQHR
jgi:predicted nucleic acid-binding protein